MKTLRPLALAALLLAASAPPAQAHADPSDASALSMLPVALSVAVPGVALSTGAVLTVAAVQVSALGTVLVLHAASGAAVMTVQLASAAAAGLGLSVGEALSVTVIGSGYVLSAAGRAVMFVPNEIGASLLYNERVTR